MNCERIQDFILTDYVDAQVGDKLKGLIDQHIDHCSGCKELLISVEKEVIAPFGNVHRAVPDGSLWAQIKQTIEEEDRRQIEKALIPDLWEKLRSVVHIPRPAFALASIVTMIFMLGSTGQLFINSQLVKVNGQEQMEYLSTLIDEPIDTSNNNGNDPQSPIEKYFL